jgi:hypothetical protein
MAGNEHLGDNCLVFSMRHELNCDWNLGFNLFLTERPKSDKTRRSGL